MKDWIRGDDGRRSVQSRLITLGPLLLLAVAIVSPIQVGAQTDQLLPEVDIYHKLNSNARVYLQAKETREGGLPVTAEIGPSLEAYLKRLSRPYSRVGFGTRCNGHSRQRNRCWTYRIRGIDRMMGLTKEQAEAVKQQEREQIPLGRRGLPDEVASWIVSFAMSESEWVTGQVLGVDGGLGLI